MQTDLENVQDAPGQQRLSIVLDSLVESANVAESLIAKFVTPEYGVHEQHDICLAVREGIANAILHGNRSDPTKKVFLTARLDDRSLIISIRDEGAGYDPDLVPDPLHSVNLLRDSGRGMLLMKTCMDEVSWQRPAGGGTELIMIKSRPQTEGEQE